MRSVSSMQRIFSSYRNKYATQIVENFGDLIAEIHIIISEINNIYDLVECRNLHQRTTEFFYNTNVERWIYKNYETRKSCRTRFCESIQKFIEQLRKILRKRVYIENNFFFLI